MAQRRCWEWSAAAAAGGLLAIGGALGAWLPSVRQADLRPASASGRRSAAGGGFGERAETTTAVILSEAKDLLSPVRRVGPSSRSLPSRSDRDEGLLRMTRRLADSG